MVFIYLFIKYWGDYIFIKFDLKIEEELIPKILFFVGIIFPTHKKTVLLIIATEIDNPPSSQSNHYITCYQNYVGDER